MSIKLAPTRESIDFARYGLRYAKCLIPDASNSSEKSVEGACTSSWSSTVTMMSHGRRKRDLFTYDIGRAIFDATFVLGAKAAGAKAVADAKRSAPAAIVNFIVSLQSGLVGRQEIRCRQGAARQGPGVQEKKNVTRAEDAGRRSKPQKIEKSLPQAKTTDRLR